MSQTVLFMHGGWLTPACWDPFVSFFEASGYRCLAPAWPGKDRSVEAIRSDPSPLAGLVRQQVRAHRASPARTELRTFPGRTHWIIAQDGWEEVAQACIDWIGSLRPEGTGVTRVSGVEAP